MDGSDAARLSRRMMVLGISTFACRPQSRTNRGSSVQNIENTNLSMARLDELTAMLTENPAAFFAEPVRFLWWLRGGEPGARSDKLELTGSKAAIRAVYLKAGFDPSLRPPTRAEEFAAPIEPGKAIELLRTVLGSPLYRGELPEERKPAVADIQRETWTFSRGEAKGEKTLYPPFPAGLNEARTLVRGFIADLVARGERNIRTPQPKP